MLPDGMLTAVDAVGRLPRDADEPVFREPWEAQTFAMTVALHEGGVFTWPEWASYLGGALKSAGPEASYYRAWLSALEAITTAKRVVEAGALLERRHAWEEAARRTPHGQPILLQDDGKARGAAPPAA